MRPRLVVGVLALVTAACGGGSDDNTAVPTAEDDPSASVSVSAVDDERALATAICEPLWAWIIGIGDRFNETSLSLRDTAEGAARRDAVLTMLDDMETSGADLLVTLDALPGRITAQLTAEVASGMERSNAELADIRQLVLDTPELDTGRHQLRLSQVIVRIEKVIDLPKPRLAPYDDPNLSEAFVAVPACQHAVKDANDGRQQYNG